MLSSTLLWARRLLLLLVALFVVAGGTILPLSASAETPVLTPEAWCAVAAPPAPLDSKRADAVMNGTVDLGKFGTYTLNADPDWSAQSTTDLAGNRNINSLDWLLPLASQGLAQKNNTMLARARNLVYDWSADHPVTRPFGDSDQPLIAGKRAIALDCLATALNDPVIQGISAAESSRMVAMERAWGSPNNTDLAGFTGLLFHACFVGDNDLRAKSESQLNRVARSLVNRDGSDVEGSPAYANYTVRLMSDAIAIMDSCNVNSQTLTNSSRALQNFVAYTIRPNFLWDTIGDSTTEKLTTTNIAPGLPLYWAASRGSGDSPSNLYSPFPDGGYLFARSAWSPQATYYSLRAVPRGRTTPHSHDDSTAFTLYSQGVQWIGDPGPYRYDKSAVRSFITKREAHSALSISGLRPIPRGSFTALKQVAGEDVTCAIDNSYKAVTMTRCVKYMRATDSFVIQDRLIDKRKAKSPRIYWIQRWQIPPNVNVAPLSASKGFQLTSGASAIMLLTDPGASLTVIPGGSQSPMGLFTSKYGELIPGNTIIRRYASQGQRDVIVTTSFIAGSERLATEAGVTSVAQQ